MTTNNARRQLLVAGGTATLALAVPGSVTGQEDGYTDAKELAPPPELFGSEWEIYAEGENIEDGEVEDENGDDGFDAGSNDGEDGLDVELQDEYTREFESENGFARLDTFVYDEDDDLDGVFEGVTDDFLVTGEEIDIGDEAFYDDIDGFALVMFRDRNAVAILLAAQMIGFSFKSDRTTALEGANTLLDYWHEEVL